MSLEAFFAHWDMMPVENIGVVVVVILRVRFAFLHFTYSAVVFYIICAVSQRI